MANIDDKIQEAIEYQKSGQLHKARELYNQVLQINPNHPDALHLLSGIAYQTGDNIAAEGLVTKAIELNPQFFLYHYNLGLILEALGKFDESVKAYEQALRCLKLDYAEAWFKLGNAMKDRGWIDVAINHYQKALSIKGDYVDAYHCLGMVLVVKGQHKIAVENYQKALSIKPDSVQVLLNLGIALGQMGEFESAIDSFRKALRICPDCVKAYYRLATIKQFTKYDDDIKSMEELLDKSDTTANDKILLNFALGKAFEDVKQFDKSFKYLSEGNSKTRDTYQYSILDDEELFNRLVSVFDTKFFNQRVDYGISENVPIFIVGMPRSGTSLVEQILSSHGQVHGAGERTDLRQSLFETNTKLTIHTFP